MENSEAILRQPSHFIAKAKSDADSTEPIETPELNAPQAIINKRSEQFQKFSEVLTEITNIQNALRSAFETVQIGTEPLRSTSIPPSRLSEEELAKLQARQRHILLEQSHLVLHRYVTTLNESTIEDDGSVTAREEEQIIGALADQNWDYRSIEGIAKETGIRKTKVRRFVKNSPKVRSAVVRDNKGRKLYTLCSRSNRSAEWIQWLKVAFGT